ncbi:MAG TPA: chemotaxis response regulator protein-glutamate methylesterase [Lachnospiraceae bacterium]|nr:chemotaxis response regulator protein-glutamate methylesterase [Lachnospiraceae bacterium]
MIRRKIRVLVVDDSVVFREAIVRGIGADSSIEVVAKAGDPFEARDMILKYEPDVMTCDVEMPRMNGIEFLQRLLPQYALPVIVVSSVSEAVFDAMDAGAVDFVAKPLDKTASNLHAFFQELIIKIKVAATSNVVSSHSKVSNITTSHTTDSNLTKSHDGASNVTKSQATASYLSSSYVDNQYANTIKMANPNSNSSYTNTINTTNPSAINKNKVTNNSGIDSSAINENRIIAIGASTGGTEAIASVLLQLPANMPGIVIVQHIPPIFSKMFAERLNNQTRLNVKEAQNGDILYPGRVLIAPGDQHMRVKKHGDTYRVEVFEGEKVNGHCPSVDVLFDSVAKEAGSNAIGVILTGMGYDGAKGLLAMRRKGAHTIGQNEETCIVYGMPKVAHDIGAVEKQVGLSEVPRMLVGMV